MSPGLGERQRLLVRLLLHCFHLLSDFVEGNGVCSGVCDGIGSVLLVSMDGMPAWTTPQKARCPALTNANARLHVFSFFVFIP